MQRLPTPVLSPVHGDMGAELEEPRICVRVRVWQCSTSRRALHASDSSAASRARAVDPGVPTPWPCPWEPVPGDTHTRDVQEVTQVLTNASEEQQVDRAVACW